MANSGKTLKLIEHRREQAADAVGEQLSRLRGEIADLAEAVQHYGSHRYGDLQQHASAAFDELRRQLPVAAEELSRHARIAGKAVRRDPLPLIVVVGTVALLSHLFSGRR